MDAKDFDLTGKTCIVTGAGRGIGRGMAEGLARHGATVVLTGRTRATLEEAAAAIGEKAIVMTADVSKEAEVVALRDAVLAELLTGGYRPVGTSQDPGYEASADFDGTHRGSVRVSPLCRGLLQVSYTVQP